MAPFSPYHKRPDFPIHLLITKKAMLSRSPLKAVPLAQTEGFEPSCRLPDNLISSQARYGHFDTAAKSLDIINAIFISVNRKFSNFMFGSFANNNNENKKTVTRK